VIPFIWGLQDHLRSPKLSIVFANGTDAERISGTASAAYVQAALQLSIRNDGNKPANGALVWLDLPNGVLTPKQAVARGMTGVQNNFPDHQDAYINGFLYFDDPNEMGLLIAKIASISIA